MAVRRERRGEAIEQPRDVLFAVGRALDRRDHVGLQRRERAIDDGRHQPIAAASFVEIAWETQLARPVNEVRLELGFDALPLYTPLRSGFPIRAAA